MNSSSTVCSQNLTSANLCSHKFNHTVILTTKRLLEVFTSGVMYLASDKDIFSDDGIRDLKRKK